MKRNRILALLGAAVLTVGTVGIALANTWSVDKPTQAGKSIDDLISGGIAEDCKDFVDDLAVGEGQIGLHFILTQPAGNSGTLTATVDGIALTPVDGGFHGNSDNGAMHFYVVVDGDGDSIVNEAVTSVNGDILTLSHICQGADEPSAPPSEPVVTAPPSFEQSEEGNTDAPSEPNTATIGGNNSSGPADGAWLLVVALGVLLASIVVLTPARAKSRR